MQLYSYQMLHPPNRLPCKPLTTATQFSLMTKLQFDPFSFPLQQVSEKRTYLRVFRTYQQPKQIT